MNEATIIRAERKAKAIDLLGGVCVECGVDGTSGLVNDKLEFDHIKRDRTDLAHALGNMWEAKWERILVELEKCQLLCRHCHAVKSQIERGGLRRTQELHNAHGGYTYRGCRCDICKKAWADYKRTYTAKRKAAMA